MKCYIDRDTLAQFAEDMKVYLRPGWPSIMTMLHSKFADFFVRFAIVESSGDTVTLSCFGVHGNILQKYTLGGLHLSGSQRNERNEHDNLYSNGW